MTTQTESRVNIAFKIIGNLKHDNKLFDRTCPSCKGMYSSYERANCPKCNAALTYLTTKAGKAMAVSEGTIGPCLGPRIEEEDNTSVKNRKDGKRPVYRFKRFAFMDDTGALGVPIDHTRMKKGTQVELTIINHQLIPSGPFDSKYGPSIELMALIYDNKKFGHNDTLVVLREAKAQEGNVPVNVDAAGKPIPTNTDDLAKEIAALEARVAAMKVAAVAQNMTSQATTQATPPDNTSQSETEAVANMTEEIFEETAVTNDGSIDPFTEAL